MSCCEGRLLNDRKASIERVYLFISPLTDMSVLPSGFFSPTDCYNLLVHNIKVILGNNFVDIADRKNQFCDIGTLIAIHKYQPNP